ncbi:MAG TPA: hypothetical protein DD473_11115 [Planctomycetaceae bacterium]|nr:hypothetical protein [Planctomycetaceae bacterium]
MIGILNRRKQGEQSFKYQKPYTILKQKLKETEFLFNQKGQVVFQIFTDRCLLRIITYDQLLSAELFRLLK